MSDDLTALAAVEETRANATALGIEWNLRPATVSEAGIGVVQAIFDGDIDPVPMITLTGYVAIGARVMVVTVPPSGNYIIGSGQSAGESVTHVNNDAAVTTTSTSFVSVGGSGTVCGIAFRAPASGKVLITWNVEINNTSATFAIASPQVASGSTLAAGIIHTGWNASFDRTRRNDGTPMIRAGASDLCEGLTPGAQYNVTLYYTVGGGTGSFGRRSVTVTPA